MPKLPVIHGMELIKLLKSIGFEVIRKKGSHVRLKDKSGKVTTIPVHSNKEVPRGLLKKIIREDLEISLDEFMKIYNK